MPAGLRWTLLGIDLSMLGYWLVAALAEGGALRLPAELMYAGYGQPMMAAWNWSFLPLDLAFSVLGLLAVWRARSGLRWQGHAIASLSLMACAGGMALTFWLLIGFFGLSWWIPNLVLLLVPLAFLPRLMAGA